MLCWGRASPRRWRRRRCWSRSAIWIFLVQRMFVYLQALHMSTSSYDRRRERKRDGGWERDKTIKQGRERWILTFPHSRNVLSFIKFGRTRKAWMRHRISPMYISQSYRVVVVCLLRTASIYVYLCLGTNYESEGTLENLGLSRTYVYVYVRLFTLALQQMTFLLLLVILFSSF